MKNDNLEAQSRRDNLKFYNVEEEQNETWEQSENKIRAYLSDELNSEGCHTERTHRLPRKSKPMSLIAKFSFFKDKDKVLKRYREKRKTSRNQGEPAGTPEPGSVDTARTEVRVSEAFPERVTRMRSLLYPFLVQSLEGEKHAYFRYDKLVVDNVTYTYDETLKQPVPVMK